MFGWDDQRTYSEKTRDALTSAKKNKIKSLIGKCEACGTKFDAAHLDVHHISEAANADGNTDKNIPGNLIVLDPTCHRKAHNGDITKTSLKSKVSKRPERVKKELKSILKGRPLVTDGTDGSPFISNPIPLLPRNPSPSLMENPFGDELPKPKRKKPKGTNTKRNKRQTRADDDDFIIRL